MKEDMLTLYLKDFGKFKNISFDISDVSVFFGKNESGKTTIFDAFLYTLSKPDTSTHAKTIRGRYGKDMSVILEGDVFEDKLPMDAYVNLYAIRQSDVVFNIGDNKAWQKTLRLSLYKNDIDIDSIIDDITAEITSKSQGRLCFEKLSLMKKYETIKEECALLYEEEKKLLYEIENINESIKNINIKKNGIETEKKNILEIEKSISKEEDAIQKRRYIKILEEIKEYKNICTYLEKNKMYALDKSSHVREAVNSSSALRKNIEMLENMKNEKYADGKNKESVIYKIDNVLHYIKTSRKNNIPILKIISIAAPIISLFIFFLTKNALSLIGIAFIFMFFIKPSRNDKNIIEKVCSSLMELNINQKKIKSLEELYEILLISKNNIEKEKTDYVSIEKQIEELEKEIYANNIFLQKLKEEYRLSNEEGYFENINEYKRYLFEKNKLDKNINEYISLFSLPNINMLEVEIERLLKDMDKNGRTYTSVNEEEIIYKKNEYKKLRSAIDEKEKNITLEENTLLIKRSSFYGKYEQMPEKIVNLESQIKEIENRQNEIEKEEKSFNIALEIFKKIKSENELKSQNIWDEARMLFSEITGMEDRTIKIDDLNSNKIYLSDKTSLRHIEHMSSATKASFLMILRLSIISKLIPSGIILLDDPFITFDEERTDKMLYFLKEYVKKFGIKIVFFTKDNILYNKILSTFENVKVYNI